MFAKQNLNLLHFNHNIEELKKEANKILLSQNLPSNKEESWRNINLKLIPLNEFQFDSQLKTNISQSLNSNNNLEENFLREILSFNYKKELSEIYKFSLNYFSIMNIAFLQNLNYIYIPKESKDKIKIIHNIISGNAPNFFTIIKVDSFSELEIIEEIESNKNQNLWNFTTFIIAEENCRIKYTNLRNFSDSDFFFPRVRILQKRDSYVHFSVFQKGGILGKSFVEARLLEENAEFRGIGFYFGEKGQYHNIEMSVGHYSNYEKSSILYKAIVKDRAHSVFIGQLETKPAIKKVVSNQYNHNLVLNKKAKAESRPWLIVRSEDVQCEHGATAGDLDEDAIFYLQLRGLSEKEARRLLMIGFIYDLLLESALNEEEREQYIENLSKNL